MAPAAPRPNRCRPHRLGRPVLRPGNLVRGQLGRRQLLVDRRLVGRPRNQIPAPRQPRSQRHPKALPAARRSQLPSSRRALRVLPAAWRSQLPSRRRALRVLPAAWRSQLPSRRRLPEPRPSQRLLQRTLGNNQVRPSQRRLRPVGTPTQPDLPLLLGPSRNLRQ